MTATVAAVLGDGRTQTGVLYVGCEEEGASGSDRNRRQWLGDFRRLSSSSPVAGTVQAEAESGRNRAPETLTRIQTQISSLAQFTGPLPWIEVGGL